MPAVCDNSAAEAAYAATIVAIACVLIYLLTYVAIPGAEVDSVESLSFETLVAKNILDRYVSLLVEHRRLILCGPTGTGKSYLAARLAQHLVRRSVILRSVILLHLLMIRNLYSAIMSLGGYRGLVHVARIA